MSLIIKGVDMPEKCDNCDLIQFDDEGLEAHCPLSPYYRWCGTPPDYRPEGCPLVKVPTPHGRLIDGDSLIEYINKELKGDEYIQRMFRRIVKSRPTVIEAEASE